MKNWFNKILIGSTAVSLFLIVVYGLVYAQQNCCLTIVNTSAPIPDRIKSDDTIVTAWASSSSHQSNKQLQSTPCFINCSDGFGAGSTCCETDRCDSYNQFPDFSLSSITNFYLLQKNATSFNTGNGAQTTIESHLLTTSLRALPIYLVTQSIIC